MKRDMMWQWRVEGLGRLAWRVPRHVLVRRTYVGIDGILPPLRLGAGQGEFGLLEIVKEELQLTSDEVCVSGVAGPSADIDDVQTGVDECAHGGELGKDEGRGVLSGGDGESDARTTSRRGQGGET